MTIRTVDFKDKKFQDLVKYYCLNSSPFEEVDSLFSISSINLESERYINKLSRCDLSICAISDSGEYIFFAFFNEKENEIDLHFAFPNQIKSFSTEIMRAAFYALCLEAIKIFGIDEIRGEINRRRKLDNFRIFMKRYIKAIDYKDKTETEKPDIVSTNKEKLLKHYEEIKI